MSLRRIAGRLRELGSATQGLAFLEFALVLPMFLGLALGAIEFGNYTLANVKTQRLAAMMADLMAQSGTGQMGVSEAQIYDLFTAIDVSAQPYDIRNDGRVVITAVQGQLSNPAVATSPIVNRILWQRFDGGYVAAAPNLGCWKTNPTVTLPRNRQLMKDEILFHAQVTLNYQSLLGDVGFLSYFNIPTSFTRTAVFRPRSATYVTPQSAVGFTPKDSCTSSNGLPG